MAREICRDIFGDGVSTFTKFNTAIDLIMERCGMSEDDAMQFVLDYMNTVNFREVKF